MKKIMSGNASAFGDFVGFLDLMWETKHFRYVVATKGNGLIHFDYAFRGTNNFSELLKPSIILGSYQIIDTKTEEKIKERELAKMYLKSLSEKQKARLAAKLLLGVLPSKNQKDIMADKKQIQRLLE